MPSRRRSTTQRRARNQNKEFDPHAFLTRAGVGRTLLHYAPKHPVFSQGEPADAVFYIQEGRVRLSVISKQGKEATISLLGPGDFVGEGCLASDQPLRLSTATTIAACSVLRINRLEMLRTLHEEHALSDVFVAYVIERYNRTQADLVDQCSIPAKSVWPERS